MVINNCPICNSKAVLDSTGCSECYGHAWQTLYIECSKENDEHCLMEVSIVADFHNMKDSEKKLVNLWNSL